MKKLLARASFTSAVLAGALACAVAVAADKDAKDPKEKPVATSSSAPSPLSRRGKDVGEDTMLAFLSQYQSEIYKVVEVVRAKDPKKYDEMKKDLINEVRHLLDMKDKRPALFDVTVKDRTLQFKSVQLSKDIRNPTPGMSPADIAARKEELRRVVAEHFGVRQELRKLELDEQQKRVEELQRQLEEARKALAEREGKKADLIGKHFDELLRPKPKLDW